MLLFMKFNTKNILISINFVQKTVSLQHFSYY
nr:MAG TPA: hypothetical protein [Caudoviricetes sp.]